MRENEKNQTCCERRKLCLAQRCARRFEKLPIRNTGRTCGLARTTAQAPVDVRSHRLVVRRDGSFEKRSHQEDSAARTFVLVFKRQIRRTRLKAEAAVNARVDSRERRSQRSSLKGTRGPRVGRNHRLVQNRQRQCRQFSRRGCRDSGCSVGRTFA